MKWFSTGFPGVRYRKHPTRKHGVRFDQYFAIRYQYNKKRVEEGLGWASDGWSAQRAAIILRELKDAQTSGKGPTTLREKRQQRDEKQQAEQDNRITLGEIFTTRYFPQACQDKARESCTREKSLFKLWLKPTLGKLTLSEIAPIHLERIKKAMASANKSPRSIQYALALIRQVFNYATRHGLFYGANPVQKVKKPSIDNKRVRFLTRDEAQTLLATLRKESRESWEIALLSLHCGLRAGEIFKLTHADIHVSKKLLFVKGKGGRNRFAFMTKEVKEMLSKKKTDDPNALLFTGSQEKLRREVPFAFRRVVSELGFNNGIKDSRNKVVFHTLRHTYASWLVQQGEDLYVVKDRLGHSTLAMTERYSHLAPDSGKRTVEKIENFFNRSRENAEAVKET